MPTKGMRFPAEVLTPEEVRAILAVVSKRGRCGVRDRALYSTIYRSGIRVGEALSLLPRDVSLESGEINVRFAKGSKSRIVAVDPETIALIRHWLDVRRSVGPDAPLFCTLPGGPLSRVQVTQHLKFLAARAGIEKRVHPHGLRHTLASELVREGVDLTTIQGVLGHSKASTTNTYLNHIQPQRVIDTLRERKW